MSGYGEGYQDALADVLVKWEIGGAEAARLYIHDNIADAHAIDLAKDRARDDGR
jgi:hypothetical protein